VHLPWNSEVKSRAYLISFNEKIRRAITVRIFKIDTAIRKPFFFSICKNGQQYKYKLISRDKNKSKMIYTTDFNEELLKWMVSR